MGRGRRKRPAVGSSGPIALSDTRQSRVPDGLTTRLVGEAHGAPGAGERVELVKSKGASGGVKRGERGTVLGQAGTLLKVAWDGGLETELKLGSDRYEVVTAREVDERHDLLNGQRLGAGSRVLVSRLRSPAAKTVLKRQWRGLLEAVLEDGTVEVVFDKLGRGLTLDPLLDTLENVTGEEQARARELALARLGAGLGMRLELTADIPGEAKLRAGKQGTVVDFNGQKLGMDWDDGTSAADLLPESDAAYIKVIAPPGTVDVDELMARRRADWRQA